jgi:hypothetical protein
MRRTCKGRDEKLTKLVRVPETRVAAKKFGRSEISRFRVPEDGCLGEEEERTQCAATRDLSARRTIVRGGATLFQEYEFAGARLMFGLQAVEVETGRQIAAVEDTGVSSCL